MSTNAICLNPEQSGKENKKFFNFSLIWHFAFIFARYHTLRGWVSYCNARHWMSYVAFYQSSLGAIFAVLVECACVCESDIWCCFDSCHPHTDMYTYWTWHFLDIITYMMTSMCVCFCFFGLCLDLINMCFFEQIANINLMQNWHTTECCLTNT